MSCKKWILWIAFASSVSSSTSVVAHAQNASATHSFDQSHLSISSLEHLWQERENPKKQSEILDFLQTYPKIEKNFEIDWRISRLVYYIGNFGIGKTLPKSEQVKLFQYGYKSAEVAKALEPNRVEGYYWFATNLGSYGLAKGILSALSNAKEGRDALIEAAKIDPSYQWGGPYRILGRYYQEVPSVISFGDKKKALEYYEKALSIEPDFRLNLLYLGVLQKKLGNTQEALRLFESAEKKPDKDGRAEENRYKQELKENIDKLKK